VNTATLLLPLLLLLLCAYTCSVVARNKGLDPLLWGVAGFFFNVLTLAYLLTIPARRR
jgi:hypothetical protein